MEVRELTCIGCPLGCQLTVTMGNDEIKVEGNTCPRGEAYAKKEVTKHLQARYGRRADLRLLRRRCIGSESTEDRKSVV